MTASDHIPELPVPWNFPRGIAKLFTTPHALPPGTDHRRRHISPTRPRPVLLVHGAYANSMTDWSTYAPLLHNEGYAAYTLNYGTGPRDPWPLSCFGGRSSIAAVGAPAVAAYIDEILAETGADQIDVIAHSMGGLVAGYVAKHLRPGTIATFCALGSPWEGTGGPRQWAYQRRPSLRGIEQRLRPSWEDMTAGSDFLRSLWEPDGSPYAAGVQYLNIATKYEQFVTPYTSSLVPGPNVTNVVLQDGSKRNFTDHAALAVDPRAADIVLNALDAARAVPPRNVATFPGVGPLRRVPRRATPADQ